MAIASASIGAFSIAGTEPVPAITSAGILLSGEIPEVGAVFAVAGMTVAQIALKGYNGRAGSVFSGTPAQIAISGGTASTGLAHKQDAVNVSFAGQSAIVKLQFIPTATDIVLSGGNGIAGITVVGNRDPSNYSDIILSSGPGRFGRYEVISAADVVISGDAIGFGLILGLTTESAPLAFSGGTIVLTTGFQSFPAPIWFSGGVVAEQLESAQGKVVVLNANTLAVSEYIVDALDVVEHNGEVYFVTATSLSKLVALGTATDFIATAETGMISLGADEKKFIPDFKTTLSGDSTTQVWMTVELDGRTVEMGPYELPGRSGAASFVRKWRMAGGVKADSMSLRFEGTDGTAWKLAGLTAQAELL